VDEFNESGADKARKAAAHIGKDFLPRLTGKTQGNNWDTIGAIEVLGEMEEAGENEDIMQTLLDAGKHSIPADLDGRSPSPLQTQIIQSAINALRRIARKNFRNVRRIICRELGVGEGRVERSQYFERALGGAPKESNFCIQLLMLLVDLDRSLEPVLESFLEFLHMREKIWDDIEMLILDLNTPIRDFDPIEYKRDELVLTTEEKHDKICEFWRNSMRTSGGRVGAIRSYSELISGMAGSAVDRQEFKDSLVFLCLLILFPEEPSEVRIWSMSKAMAGCELMIEMNFQRIVNELKIGDWRSAEALSENIASRAREMRRRPERGSWRVMRKNAGHNRARQLHGLRLAPA